MKTSFTDDYEKKIGQNKAEISPNTTLLDEELIERFLIYAESGVGKTYALCGVMDHFMKKDPSVKIFFLSTDGGLAKVFMGYFGEKAKEFFKNNVEYYEITDVNKLETVMQIIKKKAKKTDLLMVDMISDIWEMAQDEFMEVFNRGGSLVEIVKRTAQDPEKFGFFKSTQWQVVKRLDNCVSFYMVAKPFCNIFVTATRKDMKMQEIMETASIKKGNLDKHSEIVDIYDSLGYRPGGQKTLVYKFDSIVYLSGNSLKSKTYTMVKDRGMMLDYQEKRYDGSLYEEVLRNRKGDSFGERK